MNTWKIQLTYIKCLLFPFMLIKTIGVDSDLILDCKVHEGWDFVGLVQGCIPST